jgi:hypothetical protein
MAAGIALPSPLRRPAPMIAATGEATRVHGAPGAGEIVEWINAHLDAVRIVPTDIGIDQQRRLEEGATSSASARRASTRRRAIACANNCGSGKQADPASRPQTQPFPPKT